jgi:dsDNA-specific endonuclease/ATPase MutS2
MGKKKGRAPSFSSQIPSLDLHGVLADDVFDLIDRFLRREEAGGADRVRIIHGKGTGKVKEKALEYCRLAGHSPQPDTGEGIYSNPGSFLLYL